MRWPCWNSLAKHCWGKPSSAPRSFACASYLDAFVTVDKYLRYQQNLRERPFRIVLLRAHSNAIENLVPLVAPSLLELAEMQPGDLRVVGV